MATRTSRLIVALTDRASGPAGRIGRSLDHLDRRAGTFGSGMRRSTSLTGKMATAMGAYAANTAAAAAPLAAGFGLVDTIRTAANFETRLTEIAKKGGLSAEALARVKDEILGIVESGKIAMDPAEIAEAYERGIAAGIPLEKMRQFTMLSVKAADAWGMTGEDVGNAFAGFNTTMGISFDQMERFADLINTLADAGISDERDIVAFLDRAGATLQTFGMSREQIAAYGATLLNLKMPSEVAARAMNTLSTKLLTPKATKASTQAFSELYGSADAFVEMLKDDANGALKDFPFKLRDLDKFRRAEILTGILGQGFADEVNRLVEALPELERNLKLSVTPELYVGSLDASYQKKLDTMEAKWKVFKANLEKLQIDLGNLILPPAGDFLQDMTNAANDFSDALAGIKTTWETLRAAVRGEVEKRTLQFPDRKIIVGSTPIHAETSHVLAAHERSDKRVFEVPCPECGDFHEIRWKDIDWPEGKPEEAAWVCPGCGSIVAERNKPAMVAAGRWRATAPHVKGHAGFRINALVSPLANTAWGKLAAEFLAAKHDPALLMTFVNTVLGEGWREQGEEIDETALAARAERFDLDLLPPEVLALTAGVDVQRDRLEVTFVGWAQDDTAFVVGHRVVWGLPDDDETWSELDELLKMRFPHPAGGRLALDAVAIDSGDGETMERAYAFAFPRFRRKVLAVKGVAGNRPWIEMSKSKVKGGRLFIVGVDGIKSHLNARLTRGSTIRFSDKLSAEWFEQLASERVMVRYRRGQPFRQFERIPGRRAEALDCVVYAFAARQLVNVNWASREEALRSPAAPQPAPARPRVIQSAWMES